MQARREGRHNCDATRSLLKEQGSGDNIQNSIPESAGRKLAELRARELQLERQRIIEQVAEYENFDLVPEKREVKSKCSSCETSYMPRRIS